MDQAVTQQIWLRLDDKVSLIELPAPDRFVIAGVAWGHWDELFSPAFWKCQATFSQHGRSHQLGENLIEETAACLLGGYGIPAELGLAAFYRLRREDLLQERTTEAEIEVALARPFVIAGKSRRYRFPRQKARYLVRALQSLPHMTPPECSRHLRDELMSLPGIGPKTASWIVRNHRDSDDVAIIDVHILRAGRMIGLFDGGWRVPHDYQKYETAFLCFCDALSVRASLLDSIIWDFMRRLGPTATRASHRKFSVQ